MFTKLESEVDTMKSQKKRKKYRIKSRPRFIISVMIMAGLIIAGFNFITGLNETTALERTQYTEVEVVSGDTLWNIADEYKGNDTDPRDAVYRISRINDVKASELEPGMILKIPENL